MSKLRIIDLTSWVMTINARIIFYKTFHARHHAINFHPSVVVYSPSLTPGLKITNGASPSIYILHKIHGWHVNGVIPK